MIKRRKSTTFNPGELAIQLRENATKAFSQNVLSPEALLDSVYGISLDKNLPLQYILGVDVLALGRCMSLVGSYSSTKSSLGWYLAKLFLELGGLVVQIDTEHKQNPDQIRAIIDDDTLFERILFTKADSLDQMLDYMFFWAKEYEKIVPEKNIPMLIIVDSLNAVTSEDAGEKRMKGEETTGYAGARNAGEIQEAMRSFVPKCLDRNPILAVIINHQKLDMSRQVMPGMAAPKKEPGGVHKDFMYTWKLELAKAETRKSVYGEVPYFKIKAGKSSLGVQHKYAISVPYKSFYTEDGLEHIYYDWDEALATLLTSDAVSKTQLKDMMHLVKTGNKYSSNTHKISDESASELGAAIHADPVLCEKLKKDLLRIRKKRKMAGDTDDTDPTGEGASPTEGGSNIEGASKTKRMLIETESEPIEEDSSGEDN
jgi:hypothetical protein